MDDESQYLMHDENRRDGQEKPLVIHFRSFLELNPVPYCMGVTREYRPVSTIAAPPRRIPDGEAPIYARW